MILDDLKNKRIAIVGLGTNNQFLAKYLAARGIAFTVVDNWTSPEELKVKLAGFDILFRTPGVPYFSRPIQSAKARNAVIYSQTKLFFDLCPAKIIGVTGTKGKGTTATLIAKILEKTGRTTWLAGNIGNDPFEFIDKIKPEDWVVLELSSFQLQDMHRSPHIAVVLKITPEHLDHHQSFQEYVDAKQTIVRFQSAGDFAVLNYDSDVTRNFAAKTKGQILWNSIEQEVKPGCFVKDGKIFLNEIEIMKIQEVGLTGHFNLENVTAALAACAAAGLKNYNLAREVIIEFKGLPHRLEFVSEVKGVKFYDDSFSTTPETAVAAISAFDQPLILIVGGSEKKSDYTALAKKIAESKIKALLAVGLTGPKIAKLARKAGYEGRIYEGIFPDMRSIVERTNEIAVSGDVVLLSPASASFDMFENYKQRGELFKKFVQKLDKTG